MLLLSKMLALVATEFKKDAILRMETRNWKWNAIKKFGWKCVKIEIKVI